MDRSKYLISGSPSANERFIHAGGEGGLLLAGRGGSAAERGPTKLGAPTGNGGSWKAGAFDDLADEDDGLFASW